MDEFSLQDLRDLDAMLEQREREQEIISLSGSEEYPLESPDSFSCEPLSFEEMIAMLKEDREELYKLLGKTDPNSKKYRDILKGLQETSRIIEKYEGKQKKRDKGKKKPGTGF